MSALVRLWAGCYVKPDAVCAVDVFHADGFTTAGSWYVRVTLITGAQLVEPDEYATQTLACTALRRMLGELGLETIDPRDDIPAPRVPRRPRMICPDCGDAYTATVCPKVACGVPRL